MFQLRPVASTATRVETVNVGDLEEEELVDNDEELPDIRPTSSTAAKSSTASTSQKKGNRDDVLIDVVQRLAKRRPAAEELREAMKEEKLDRRTAFCRYLATEARDAMSDEEWVEFKSANHKLLDSFEQRRQRNPPPPPSLHVQHQQQPLLQQQQFQPQLQAVFPNQQYDQQSASYSQYNTFDLSNISG